MNDNREQLFWEAQDELNRLKRKVKKLEARVEAFEEYKGYSDAVIEAMEYEKKYLPQRLREKLDFWFEQYKIDEVIKELKFRKETND